MKKKESQVRLAVDRLCVKKAESLLVQDVSFELHPGEVLGLIGPNGAGKSTLLATLAGIEPIAAGSVQMDGQAIESLSASQRARLIGWVEQLGPVHWPLTVERVVMLGRIPHLPGWARVTNTDREAVETALVQADCLALRDRRVATLSGGERTRVLLARAMAVEPLLLLADEPVSALDLKHQLQTMQLLKSYAEKGNAAVVVMHDLSLAARFCDRLLLMCDGRMAACGEVASVLSPANIADVYRVSVATGCDEVPWVIPREIL
ncbi:MAG: ABC transporter ATP-binding protein [Granulosicoccus sp.]